VYDNAKFQKLIEADNPTGEVVAADRSLIRVKGLESVGSGAVIMFENGAEGLVREAAEEGTLIMNLSTIDVPIGALAALEDPILMVGVGDGLIGRVVSPLGKPLDGRGPIRTSEQRQVFKEAPGVIERALLKDQLTTGVSMVDMLFPVLLGQRVAILGDSKAGKTTFLTQMGISQLGMDRIVIYCLVAKRKVDVDTLVYKLIETGAMAHSIVVVSSVFDSLAQSYVAPYAACAMGEYFWYAGRNAVMVYDDLTSHAKVYRELSLLAKGNPGRESYPGDMFYAHSSLLERAGKLAAGGGTLTALPIVLTPGNDVTAFLPTSLISITDGQVVFDLEKFRQGIRPAVNHGLSVSRVGGRGQNSRQKKLTQTLFKRMIEHQQAAEFARFGSELSAESQTAMEVGRRIYEAFKQPPDEIFTLIEQELFLSAVLKTSTDVTFNVDSTKVQARQLAKFMEGDADIDEAIDTLILSNSMDMPSESSADETTAPVEHSDESEKPEEPKKPGKPPRAQKAPKAGKKEQAEAGAPT
jgi:F-type H+-transporting ATPase subunit alpha